LREVQAGRITATSEQARRELNCLCTALDLIQHGNAPAEALRIAPGDRRNPYNIELAEMIFWERLSGTKWAAIETAANEWLSLQGRPEVSPATLHRIYKEAGNRDLERKLRRFLKESGSDLSLFRELNAGFYI
jgi:hypothetical protein